MTLQAIARRYANALYDVTTKNGSVAQARADLSSVAAVVEGHAELTSVFASPAVPLTKKRAILEQILATSSGLSADVYRLLMLLADRDRLTLVGDVARAFEARVMQAERVMAAEVVTAAPLADDRRAALVAALGRATGGTVTLTERVDPSIVGGVVARVGSIVYDGSVTHQLERLKQRLLSEA
ncbi:MAG TPA: ATP synthase F1 subunit delta [Vicinamibacterales bacterium]|nr:ATP synthase F1 subunit delta [Vicinamibacterales bacterium]